MPTAARWYTSMDCIETLARVDTLCVDKTGTITEPKMTVDDVVLLQPDRFIVDDVRMIMADYVYAMQADNDTMAALKRYFTGDVRQTALHALPFRSAKKYGGVLFHEDETYLLGAPDILLAALPGQGALFAAGGGVLRPGLPRAAARPCMTGSWTMRS